MATIKHIFKGESLTVLLTFPEAYDMARIEKHEIYIGATAFTGVVSGQTIELKLTSEQTDVMYGKQEIRLWLDDAILGVKKPYCGEIIVSNSNAKPANDSTSSVSDIIIPIVVSETAITAGDVMYNYVIGKSAYQVWLDTGNTGTVEDYLADIKGDPFTYSDFTPEQIEALKVKGDPFTYADFTPEQIEALKVKGDPFTYSDFTPEQLAELQQPAADAIASIEAVELAVEQAEVLRVQAELNRQTNTATAIQNAENATTGANNAAILANEKAGLADSKATHADQKATLANDAATLANTKAGLADAAATNANNVANTYAAELALKELKANRQNNLAPDGTGTKFPTVDAVNTGLSGKQATLVSGTNIKTVNGKSLLGSGDIDPNLITTYTHTTNTVIQPTALDPVTGIFTCNNHGLTQDKIVLWNLNRNHNLLPYQVIPIEINGGQYGNYYADVIDTNSFKIKKTPTDAPLTYASAGDITKWHFETNAVSNVTITNLPAYKKLKVITKFISNSNVWFQLYPSNVGDQLNNWYIGGAVANAHAATNSLFGANMPAYIESYFDFGEISTIRHKLYGFTHVHTSPTTVTKVTPADLCWINFNNLGALTITDLIIGSPYRLLLNGTTVEIYKI